MNASEILAGVMLTALVLYALLGGADYGAGFWDLLCSGPRRDKQRRLIEEAIEPVWEANHVWLILVVVLTFTGFPPAYATISVGLAVPLLMILLGIVLRGSSFVFRGYFAGDTRLQLHWGRVFSISSSLTPFFLGVVVGGISSDTILVTNGVSENGFLRPWFQPFPLIVGVLALSLFTYLSACYLVAEAGDSQLQDDFRKRALVSGFVSLLAAFATYVTAGNAAHGIRDGLARTSVLFIQICAAITSLIAFHALWTRRFRRVRIAAAAQVVLIVFGWGFAQYPYLVRPALTTVNSSAPDDVLRPLLIALAAGAIVLFPSLALLLNIFKSRRRTSPSNGQLLSDPRRGF